MAKVLSAGVDTLIINAKRADDLQPEDGETDNHDPAEQLSEEMVGQLEHWQSVAKNTNEPFPTSWEHEKVTLKMHPKGTSTCRWLLKNGLIDLMIGSHLNNSALARVRFSSEYLWKRGVDAALGNTHAFLMSIFQEYLRLQPAEIHLCADIVGLRVPRNYERVFVSHAALRRPIKISELDSPVYRYHRLQTLQFSGHGNAVSAVIYDKPAEIEKQSPHKRWLYDYWAARGWNRTDPVWRNECRIERKGLHEMSIEDAYDAIEKVPALWAYCVGHAGEKNGWLRMVTPNVHDSNRRRWKTDPAWVEIQKAFSEDWRGYDDMDAIQRERKRSVNLEAAEKAIAGYTTTYGAWLQQELGPHDDASIVLQRLYGKMLEQWEKKGEDFQTLRLKKQYLYNLS